MIKFHLHYLLNVFYEIYFLIFFKKCNFIFFFLIYEKYFLTYFFYVSYKPLRLRIFITLSNVDFM